MGTFGLPWGGANLNYWVHELQVRGYHLARMDFRDAVFVHQSKRPVADARKQLISTLACYLRNFFADSTPKLLLTDLETQTSEMSFLRHHWMDSPPATVVDTVWSHLTTWNGDTRFFLDV